jgi:hypothetical protein
MMDFWYWQATARITWLTDWHTTWRLGNPVRELPQDDSQDATADVSGRVQAGGGWLDHLICIKFVSVIPFRWFVPTGSGCVVLMHLGYARRHPRVRAT